MTAKYPSAKEVAHSVLRIMDRHPDGLKYPGMMFGNLSQLVKEDTASGFQAISDCRLKIIVRTLVASGRIKSMGATEFKIGRLYRGNQPDSDTPVIDPVLDDLDSESNDKKLTKLKELVDRQTESLAEFASKLKKAEEDAQQPQGRVLEVQLKQGEKTVKVIEDLFHEEFERLLDLAKARMNIFIYGPTGCGKSHVCGQLAKAMDLRFAFISCTSGMSEGQVAGRLLPLGKAGTFEYVTSEFIDCYENGGVFLFDEIDAADPNVLLIINAALANGQLAVPNRPDAPYAKRHPDFICVAAANTAGTNADRLYSGRNKLDAATLDRFQLGKVVFNYDSRVEEMLCPDVELRNRCLRIRSAISEHRLERCMSTRFMRDAFKMKSEYKWTQDKIDAAFFAGWREDEINKVKQQIG